MDPLASTSAVTDPRRAGAPRPTLVVALGNDILCDDRVGFEVSRGLRGRLPPERAVFVEALVGGLELLHVLEGWDEVVIIDSVEPGRLAPGELREISLGELERSYAPITPHNAGLCYCLELGRRCGLRMPSFVRVFAIGVDDPYTFSEACTPGVQRAIPGIVEEIARRAFSETTGRTGQPASQ